MLEAIKEKIITGYENRLKDLDRAAIQCAQIAEQEKIAFAIQVLTDLTEKTCGYSFKDVANKLLELKSLQDATKTN